MPLYVLNVTYPLIDDEFVRFCARQEGRADGRGRPAGLHRAGLRHRCCARAGVGSTRVHRQGRAADGRRIHRPGDARRRRRSSLSAERCCPTGAAPKIRRRTATSSARRRLGDSEVPARPPGFCIGCPERPIFAAMKLVEQELGQHHVARRHRLPPVLDPAAVQYRRAPPWATASARPRRSAFNVEAEQARSISVMGDGGFWHNGLTSGIGNAVFNKNDGVIVVVDNFYSAATGGQDILSSRAEQPVPRPRSIRSTKAVRGRGRRMGAPPSTAPTTSPRCATR